MSTTAGFYIEVSALGKEVTGSCILNTIHFPDGSIRRVLVDCGLFQESDYLSQNKSFPFDPSAIQHVIVTHNHVDHTGRLPLLVKEYFSGKIHTSIDTSRLLPYALMDSYKVLKKKSELTNEKLLYTENDVHKTISLVEAHPFEESIWIDPNIKLTFFMNGHLPGAAIVLMQVRYHDHQTPYKEINMLYTGDFNNKNMFFDVTPIPKWVHQLPINIIQEATYGSSNSFEVEKVFEKNIFDALANQSEIVIPVFSLGRAQEILLILKQWQDEGKLDVNIPIYFDGKLAMKYTNLYTSNSLYLDDKHKNFLPRNLNYVTENLARESLIASNGCKIIITTSGMGSYGPAQVYLPAFLKKPNALIHFTGYLAENTLGRKLYESEKDSIVEVAGLQVKKMADLKFTSEFSAHAKADELIDFLRPFENIRLLLINHGEVEKKSAYAHRVLRELSPSNVGILDDTYTFRVNRYGFVKSFTTTLN